ncbi:hypothetical protein HK098_006786 [Nowakowskiella sp. JEL0407]|nr:hypothetical protein HK098_006786 [Nowakowskiella sp. JEL0407]
MYLVCKIPVSSVLSIKTCGIADVLEEHQLGGILGLAIAVMFEISIGQSSIWYGYLQSLPKILPLPLFWLLGPKPHHKKALQYLEGMELYDSIQQHLTLLRQDYDGHVVPLIETLTHGNQEMFTFERFCTATALCMSRAFEVNEYHGHSLVPLADIFNHVEHENVHIETDQEVCPQCGEHGGCDCFESESTVSSTPSLTLSDSHIPTYDDDEKDDEEDEEDRVKLSITVVNACKKGAEVYNTYGKLSNAGLLQRYGFTLEDNIYDVINIEPELVLRNVLSVMKSKKGWWSVGPYWMNLKKVRAEIDERVEFWVKSCSELIVESEMESEDLVEDFDDDEMEDASENFSDVESSVFSQNAESMDDDEDSFPPLYFQFDGTVNQEFDYLCRILLSSNPRKVKIHGSNESLGINHHYYEIGTDCCLGY